MFQLKINQLYVWIYNHWRDICVNDFKIGHAYISGYTVYTWECSYYIILFLNHGICLISVYLCVTSLYHFVSSVQIMHRPHIVVHSAGTLSRFMKCVCSLYIFFCVFLCERSPLKNVGGVTGAYAKSHINTSACWRTPECVCNSVTPKIFKSVFFISANCTFLMIDLIKLCYMIFM